jgi:hypothetical protein
MIVIVLVLRSTDRVPARQYRRPRRFEDFQGTLDFDEPPQDALAQLERIASLPPERLQLLHDLVEPSVDMPSQLVDLVRDRRSARRRHCASPTFGVAIADRPSAAAAGWPARAEIDVGEEFETVHQHQSSGLLHLDGSGMMSSLIANSFLCHGSG